MCGHETQRQFSSALAYDDALLIYLRCSEKIFMFADMSCVQTAPAHVLSPSFSAS